jgi:hypothetical protein
MLILILKAFVWGIFFKALIRILNCFYSN